MAKKDKKQEESINSKIIKQAISAEVKESYLNYAMSVITARALPDVRDGLKPVHRRILYAMYKSGLTPNAKTKKSATVVGEVIGKYHPHGDAAVYDAMVVMAQDFSMRYPLVIGQGNFGSIDGDPAAAYRYTEAKLSPIAIELLKDIEKDTVDFRPNFDNTHKEPVVLPAAVPNLLLNGTLGIAVGMATNIPPHNLKELIDATVYLIDNKDATVEDLLKFVKGPDFPTGAIAFNKKDIANAYATGRGGVLVRGEAEIAEGKRGQYQIIISSLPYRVNKASLLQKIAGLVQDKKLDGIKDIRDESTDEIRIVIELKSSAHPQSVLNYIYKHTQLEETFHYNMVALVDGVPQTLSLKSILENYISHRKEVVTRRTKYDLNKAKAREHILIGLKKALDHIDEIIKLIKSSKDVPTAHANLMKKFKFSEIQATAILEMKLQKLANLERKKIEEELKQIQKLIKELEAILKSEKKLMNLIKKELQEVAQKHGDERRTKIVARGAKNFSMEDLIPDEDFALVLTKGGYVKRTNPSEYKKQKRGGVGVVDMNTKEEDVVSVFLTASAHSDLLFFTDKGKVYKIKMYEIPEAKRHTRGKAIANFLAIEQGERITSVLAMPKDLKDEKGLYLFMATKKGIVKKTEAKQFFDVRRNGLIAIKLADGDRLISAAFVRPENDIILITRKGQSIRFAENEVRAMGRSAAGVKGIILKDGDELVGAGVIEKGQDKKKALLVVSSNGYGKKTLLSEYRSQSRAGSGIKTMQITDKTKELVGASVIDKEGGELIAISKGGVVIRTDLDEIKLQGRQTQGVRIMKLKGDDELASIITLEDSVE